MPSRREFLVALTSGIGIISARAAAAKSQQVTQTFSGPMQQDAYQPAKLAAKPNAAASMSVAQRDDLEHQIKCQCGCPLDVYTCRTTDFSCSVSPRMHSDVMSLVSGGYSAAEILRAFQDVYGERVLMSPVKAGFNWLGYLTPSVVIAAGAIVLYTLIRRWGARAALKHAAATVPSDATPAERDAIDAALRNDS
ncbi:MAG TPA: cytochrome c-type biogenesis protein CcmH [Gemmatimonadaceae bacterium]|nr:cytochrome c-type biogenesis protein CcmH [Gemmatimonadaceae bacterium]